MNDEDELHEFSVRDGCRINCRIYRNIKPQSVLLLLPGFGLSSDDYIPFCERLVKTTPTVVYSPDLRGHGKSQGVPGDVAYIGQLQDDLTDLLAAIKYRHPGIPLIIAAHSGSSSLAIAHLAAQQDSVVRALYLIAPVFFGYMEFDRQIKPAYRYIYYGKYNRVPHENVASKFNVNQQFRYSLKRHLIAEALPFQRKICVLQVRRDKEQPWKKYSFRYLKSYRCPHLQNALEKISVPVRVLVGAEDEVILPDAVISTLHWHLAPNILREMRCLRGMGHFSILAVSALLVSQWLRVAIAEIDGSRS
ncbi:alpha/beta hydrolase [Aeromonas hydrophila]|uniref:alpha/beta hydrolase n=1 Tax=Aeromonas hydrophila TaxID=644 RepID=UPI0018902224|nr:alpha/beta fold hydrolase [Aeromonas hydrophila]MBF4801481.1 lysophospholipase [Aeromonas hydrophila]